MILDEHVSGTLIWLIFIVFTFGKRLYFFYSFSQVLFSVLLFLTTGHVNDTDIFHMSFDRLDALCLSPKNPMCSHLWRDCIGMTMIKCG